MELEELKQQAIDLRDRLRETAASVHPRARSHFDNAGDLADRILAKLEFVESVYVGTDYD